MGHFEIFNGGPFFSQFKMMVLGTIAATQDCNPPFLFHGRHQKGGPQGSFGRTIDADIIAGDHQDGRHAFVHFFRRHFGNQSGCIARSTMDCFRSFVSAMQLNLAAFIWNYDMIVDKHGFSKFKNAVFEGSHWLWNINAMANSIQLWMALFIGSNVSILCCRTHPCYPVSELSILRSSKNNEEKSYSNWSTS